MSSLSVLKSGRWQAKDLDREVRRFLPQSERRILPELKRLVLEQLQHVV